MQQYEICIPVDLVHEHSGGNERKNYSQHVQDLQRSLEINYEKMRTKYNSMNALEKGKDGQVVRGHLVWLRNLTIYCTGFKRICKQSGAPEQLVEALVVYPPSKALRRSKRERKPQTVLNLEL